MKKIVFIVFILMMLSSTACNPMPGLNEQVMGTMQPQRIDNWDEDKILTGFKGMSWNMTPEEVMEKETCYTTFDQETGTVFCYDMESPVHVVAVGKELGVQTYISYAFYQDKLQEIYCTINSTEVGRIQFSHLCDMLTEIYGQPLDLADLAGAQIPETEHNSMVYENDTELVRVDFFRESQIGVNSIRVVYSKVQENQDYAELRDQERQW